MVSVTERGPHLPSRELTYPRKKDMFEDDLPFPKVGNVIVSWREYSMSNEFCVPTVFAFGTDSFDPDSCQTWLVG